MREHRKALPSLSDAEWVVMKAVWEAGPLAARDVYARVSKEQAWAYATVKTLLRRMVAKGWLTYTRVGSSFLYRAAVARQKAVKSAVRDFAQRVLDGLLSPVVAYFAEGKGLTGADLEQLEVLLRRHRPRKRKGG